MSSLASLPESDIDDDDSRSSLPSVSESVAHSVGSTAAQSASLDEAAAAARAAVALDRGHDYSGALAMYRLVVTSLRRADVSEGSRAHSAVAQRLPGYERRVAELERHLSNRSASSTNQLFNSNSNCSSGADGSRNAPPAERSTSYTSIEASEPTSSPRRVRGEKSSASAPSSAIESSSHRLLLPPPTTSPGHNSGGGGRSARGGGGDIINSRFLGRDRAARSSGGSSSSSGVYGMLTSRDRRRGDMEHSRNYNGYDSYTGSRSGGARKSSTFGLSSLATGRRERERAGRGGLVRRLFGSSSSGRRIVAVVSAVGAVAVAMGAQWVGGGGSRHSYAQAPSHWPHRYKTYGFEPPPSSSAKPWAGYGGSSIHGGAAAAAGGTGTGNGYADSSRSSSNSGSSGNGRETVVLIPGLDSSAAYFSDLVPELTASGLRVVVFYLPLATLSGHAFPHPPLPLPASASSSSSSSSGVEGSSATARRKNASAAAVGRAAGAPANPERSHEFQNDSSSWSSFLPSLLKLEEWSDEWRSWWKRGSSDGMTADTVYDLDYISAELQRVLLELQLVKPGSNGYSAGGVHVVGESFGGVVATTFARRHPPSVKSLVLVSSACRAALSQRIFLEAALLLPIAKLLGRVVSPSLAQQLFAMVYSRDVVAPSEAPWIRDLFTKEATSAHHFSVVARASVALHLNECPAVGASLAKTPALIVYGANDYDSMALSLELFAAIHSGGHADAATTAAAAAATAATAGQSFPPFPGAIGTGNTGNNGGSKGGVSNAFINNGRTSSSSSSKVSLLALPGGRWPHLTSPKRLATAVAEMARTYK